MDMDSTLIVNEVIDEIARVNGCYDQVAEVTERAMNGELDFNESLVERVKCLAGAPASVFDDVYNVIELTPGAEDFVWALQTMGYKIAVVSGGFNQITNRVKNDMGIDFAFANTLEVIDGRLTGPSTWNTAATHHSACNSAV
jgi:phosphoserine phosphatase